MKWPKGTQFWWYAEGYMLPRQPDEKSWPIVRRYVDDIPGLKEWKDKHPEPPKDWRWDVVRWSNKAFAPIDAFYDYDGVGVYLDADCVTYREIPDGLFEKQVKDHYLACYQRTTLWTEAGIWIANCARPENRPFLDRLRKMYFEDEWKTLPFWFDCLIMDQAIAWSGFAVNNLSGKFAGSHHPQALSEIGAYVDHPKGERKVEGRSHENVQRAEYESAHNGR